MEVIIHITPGEPTGENLFFAPFWVWGQSNSILLFWALENWHYGNFPGWLGTPNSGTSSGLSSRGFISMLH